MTRVGSGCKSSFTRCISGDLVYMATGGVLVVQWDLIYMATGGVLVVHGT